MDRAVYIITLPFVDRSVYNGRMKIIDTPERQNLPARERILLTAHDLFYMEGIRATGIDRVIAEAGVTKVTFYRHFPSKSALISTYLEYRHRRWMEWFAGSLALHGGDAKAIIPTLTAWFSDAHFRGCAFINSVGELGGAMPEVIDIAQRHKQEMTAAIAKLLPPSPSQEKDAQAVALAIDGAIVMAQSAPAPDTALSTLDRILNSLLA